MLNENIQALRKSKSLSQEELALKLNVVRQTGSKWERRLRCPTLRCSSPSASTASTLLGGSVSDPQPGGCQGVEDLELERPVRQDTANPSAARCTPPCIAIAAVTTLVPIALAAIGGSAPSGISPIRNTRWLQRCSMDSNGDLGHAESLGRPPTGPRGRARRSASAAL